jgi:hypothetical protein
MMGYVITNARVLDGTGGAPFPGTVDHERRCPAQESLS